MEIFWDIQSDGLLASETDGLLTFSDEKGSFCIFVVEVYQFNGSKKKDKLINKIKKQIGSDSEDTLSIIENESNFISIINKTTDGPYSMFGFKVGSYSIVKFAASFEEFETKEKLIPIINTLEEEIEP